MVQKRRSSQTGDVNSRRRGRIDTSRVGPLYKTFGGDINSQPRVEDSIVCIAEPTDQRLQNGARHQSPLWDQSNMQPPSDMRLQAITRHQNGTQGRIMASDLVASLASGDSTESINLQNARDLALANRSAEQMIRANRASSTRKAYDQKMRQWKQWCLDRRFEDYDTVTENKLFYFLNSEVIPKGIQTKGKRYGAALSEQGLEGYIKPIVVLYKVKPLHLPSPASL